MYSYGVTMHRGGRAWPRSLAPIVLAFVLILTPFTQGLAADIIASNKHPLSFGPGQTIIDLKKIVWEPLKGEGIPPGARIAMLHGDLAAGGGELLVYLPAHYTFPNHSHTSDELYVWLQGDFTYIAADGTVTPLSGTGPTRRRGRALSCSIGPRSPLGSAAVLCPLQEETVCILTLK